MWEYLDPLIDERRGRPTDDLLSRLLEAELDGVKMSDEEVKGFIALLLAAGGDTTDKAIANMWFHMLYTRPDQFEHVKADPDAVGARLRGDDAVRPRGPRAAPRTRPVRSTMHGTVIPSRAMVTLSLGAGNRDDRVFADPDTFDIHRTDLAHGTREQVGALPRQSCPGISDSVSVSTSAWATPWPARRPIIACTKMAELMPGARPKFAEHEGIMAPSIDSGGFRSPRELVDPMGRLGGGAPDRACYRRAV